ncbi:MAG TPA: hypothetical protein VJN90_12290 [Candidatus Acidoferrales bacterium]|nr:hypothetical protein [Candidatus Acidoferrales bacterium]
MDEWSNLEQAIEQLTASGAVEVHEDGEWLASLGGFRSEVRRKGKQALIHLWSSESNLVRTITRISVCEPARIQLEVQRFGRAKPGRLEFLSAATRRPAARVGREQFRARFARMLAEQFPDARVESLTTAADLKRSFSALHTRGVMTEGRLSWAIMGVGPAESAAAVEGILSFGLLWLDSTRQRAERRAIEGLRLFLPEGQSRVTLERSYALRPNVGLEVYEFSERDWRVRLKEASGRGNVESWLTPRKEIELTLAAARDAVEHIRSLLPDEPEAIETSVPPATREVSFRFRGLEFARWIDGRIYFGLGDDRLLLANGNAKPLKNLLRELSHRRSPIASDTRDPLYRGAPERWLESVIRADPARLDARLDPRYFYSQVPALAAGERGVIDLLGVTRQGRLVVIELKASEDLHLPLQAVDYWLRVRRHLVEGDFRAYGYFPGVEFQPDPPLVWLVAPSLRFHPANEIVARYLLPAVQVSRIGLNENWRRGVRVTFRQ